ncbi:MAG: VOC family protein [Cellvibrionaceae bacterium]
MSDNNEVDKLLSQYEKGQLSRRTFLASLSAMAALAGTRVSAQTKPTIEITSINHVTLFVKDIPKAAEFYQSLFGLGIKSQQSNGINLSTGDDGQFLGFYGGTESVEPTIHHVCLGVKDFDVEKIVQTLAERGIQAQIRMRDETIPELYFTDPNGILIQLQDETYCGGSGVLGNNCEA